MPPTHTHADTPRRRRCDEPLSLRFVAGVPLRSALPPSTTSLPAHARARPRAVTLATAPLAASACERAWRTLRSLLAAALLCYRPFCLCMLYSILFNAGAQEASAAARVRALPRKERAAQSRP